jgi:subtilisin family serine protease
MKANLQAMTFFMIAILASKISLAEAGSRARAVALDDEVNLSDLYDSTRGTYFDIELQDHADTERLRREIAESHVRLASVKVGFLDTGVMHKHPALRGSKIIDKDFTGEGVEDLSGHGTLVVLLYLASSVLPRDKVEIYNIKVLDRSKTGYGDSVKKGMRWAAAHGIDVLNVSLGVPKFADPSVCDLAVQLSSKANMIIAASAGNDPDIPMCPAAAANQRGVISVGLEGKKAPTTPTLVTQSKFRFVPVHPL